jgi:uncharacterized protein
VRRVVLDVGIIISGLIQKLGPSGQLIDAVRDGRLEMVVCPQLLDELLSTIMKPRLRKFFTVEDGLAYREAVRQWGVPYPDPTNVDLSACRDPKDVYLLALAAGAKVDALVSGDADLTVLTVSPPVLTPRQAVERLPPDDIIRES